MASHTVAAVGNLLTRDLRIAWSRGAEAFTPLAFFLIVVSLFPLSLGPDAALLRVAAPGVLWVAALLATLLSLNLLFADDYRDGTLELLVLAPHPLPVLVLAKTAAHWLISGLPLTLMAPLLALQLNLPQAAMDTLLLALLLGTPSLSLIGAIGAALTLSARGGGALVPLLVLPLYTPVLIFGAEAVAAAATAGNPEAHLSLLGACLALSLSLAPWAAAAALRISLE